MSWLLSRGRHRDLLARRHAARSQPRRPGRPRTVRSIRQLVLRLARENPSWGYRRIHGEMLVLGVKAAASTVWEILHDAGIDPAPDRTAATWANFLRSQAGALLACDFFETVTVTGRHLFVLALDDLLIEGGKIAPFSPAETTYTAMGRFGRVEVMPPASKRATPGWVIPDCSASWRWDQPVAP